MTSPRRHKGAGCDRLRLTTERLRVSDSDSATRPTPTYLQGAYAHFLGDCNPLIITVVLERSLVSQPLGQTLLSRRSRLLLLAHIGTSYYLQSRSRFACLFVDISAEPRSNIVNRNLALVSNVQSLAIRSGPKGNHSPLLGPDAESIVFGYLNYSLLYNHCCPTFSGSHITPPQEFRSCYLF